MKSIIFSLLVVVQTIFLVSSAHATNTDILFILDGSGSMKERIKGEAKIDSARNGLRTALAEIPKEDMVGLRIYGNRIPQTNKTDSCKDTTLEIPIGSGEPAKFEQLAAKVTPLGYTPISYSLEQARGDFSTEREANKVIILLTDGEETCGGDPKATVEAMIRDGFAVKVFTIGFSVNAKAERELRDVAEVSGGKYYAASNADELKDALAAATKESLLIKKEKTIDGTPIRGGDSFETAVPLQLNTEYRLDHHQKPDFYDYFYIDGNVGEQVTIVARTLEKGLSMFHGKGSENETPSSAVSLLDPLRDKLKSVTSYGKFRRTEDKLTLRKAGRYFVLVGGNVPQNAEHSLFTIGKVSLGDGGQELDAGNDYSSALPITPGRYDSNWFTMQDDRDVYSFDGKKGEVYQIAVIREAGSTDNINLTVHSEMGDQIVRKFGSSGNPAKSDNFTLPEDGKYYISAWACCGNDVKKYSLVIKKVDASLISSEPAESK